jgi:histidinol-phosphate aminotransferase
LLVKTVDAKGLYKYLVGRGIVVRDRSSVILCDESLRITVGTPRENQALLKAIAEFEKS